jgi:hypothetical protein
VQDDGDCGLEPKTVQIVSQFANKKESGVGPRGPRDRGGHFGTFPVGVNRGANRAEMRKRGKKHRAAIFKEMIFALMDGSRTQGGCAWRKEEGEGISAVEGHGSGNH